MVINQIIYAHYLKYSQLLFHASTKINIILQNLGWKDSCQKTVLSLTGTGTALSKKDNLSSCDELYLAVSDEVCSSLVTLQRKYTLKSWTLVTTGHLRALLLLPQREQILESKVQRIH